MHSQPTARDRSRSTLSPASGGSVHQRSGYRWLPAAAAALLLVAAAPARAEADRPAGLTVKAWGTIKSALLNEDAQLTASDAAANDYLGAAVAVAGDVVVVGAPGDDSFRGTVYVFEKPAGGWTDLTEVGKLTASDRGSNHKFGASVAIAGDTVVVGVPDWEEEEPFPFSDGPAGFGDDGGDGFGHHLGAGAAYVFEKPAGGWPASLTETARLTPSDGDTYVNTQEDFGASVAISGDTIAVGAYHECAGAGCDGPGAVYVFERPAGGWTDATEDARLTASDVAAEDYAGFAGDVAISGDTVVTGAVPWMAEAVYLFEKPAGGWVNATEDARLTPTVAGGSFAQSVSISGDVVAAGAPWDPCAPAGEGCGAAYLFAEPAGGWVDMTETARLTPSDPAIWQQFGADVTLSGDQLLVGAPGDGCVWDPFDFNCYGAVGAAYHFHRPDGGWAPTAESAKLALSTPGSWFGDRLAFDSASSTTVIPATYEGCAAGSNCGAAYVFTLPNAAPTIAVTEPDGVGDTVFGDFLIAWSDDDLDGDATIDLYYDTDDMGEDGTLIAGGLAEDPDGPGNDEHLWDTTVLPDGPYYVYAVIDDGTNPPGVDYSDGPLNVVSALTVQFAAAAQSSPESVAGVPVTVHLSTLAPSDVEVPLLFAGTAADPGDYSPSAATITIPAGTVSADLTLAVVDDHLDEVDETVVVTMGTPVGAAAGPITVHTATLVDDDLSPSETARLTASDADGDDQFGQVVAVSGNTVVVGTAFAGAVYVFEKPLGGWTAGTEIAILTASGGAMDESFGQSVAISGDTVVVGAPANDDAGTNAGATYVFEKPAGGWTDMTETATLTASDGGDYDLLGTSVSISGNTIAAGVTRPNDPAGAVYVFERPAGGWASGTETAKLTAGAGAAYELGWSVSISGDTVAAISINGPGIFLFEKPGGGWADATEDALLTPTTAPNQVLSVSISGDAVVMGSDREPCSPAPPGGMLYCGAAYLFEKPAAGWIDMSETARLTASDEAPGELFGQSVALSGDRLVVGAPQDGCTPGYEDCFGGTGAAYVFEQPAAGWASGTETSKLTIDPPVDNSWFGNAVALDGGTAVVGAIAEMCAGGYSCGAAYVALVNTPPTITVTEPDGIGDTVFGTFRIAWSDDDPDDNAAIRLYYDVDAGGEDGTLIAAGLAEDPDGPGNDEFLWDTTVLPDGAYYVYAVIDNGASPPVVDYSDGPVRVVSTLTVQFATDAQSSPESVTSVPVTAQLSTLAAVDVEVPVSFGGTAADPGDYSPDTATITIPAGTLSADVTLAVVDDVLVEPDETVVVTLGTPVNAALGPITVHTATIADDDLTPLETVRLTASDASENDSFGLAVAVSGNTVVVGAPNAGAAYVFDRPTSGWTDRTEIAILTASGGAMYEDFGSSVAISGDTVVVGAPHNDALGDNAGKVYVFDKPAGGWTDMTETATLTASDAGAVAGSADSLGASVSISGNSIAAGAIQDCFSWPACTAAEGGAVYLFERPAGGWTEATETAKLTASDGEYSDQLGRAVAISGDTVVAESAGKIAVYLFEKPAGGWADATQDVKLTFTSPPSSLASLSLSGSVAAVGSAHEPCPPEVGGLYCGAVYLFEEPAGGWADMAESARLTRSDAAPGEDFGRSVALSGHRLVAGAPLDGCVPNFEGCVGGAGAAYVFDKPAGGWASGNETSKFTAGTPVEGSMFGWAVALDGTTVALGASGEMCADGYGCGAAYVTVLEPLNEAPTIEVTEPDGGGDTVDASFTIQWTDGDPDDDASISLYYDSDDTGQDGTLIAGGLSEDPDGAGNDDFTWDTTGVGDGAYFVYAVIDDGVNPPVVDYSAGPVTVVSTQTVDFTAAAQSNAESVSSVTVTAQLSALSGVDVGVPVSFGGTAADPADYSPSSATIIIPAGMLSASLTLTVVDDALDEADETVVVTMGVPVNAMAGTVTVHTATIEDDDPAPTVSFIAPAQSNAESVTGVTVTAQLSALSGKEVEVPLTFAGTAADPADYSPDTSTLVIPAGQMSADLTLTVVDDALDEGNEIVDVSMGTPVNAGLGATTVHTAVIQDDDPPPVVEFTAGFQSNAESVTPVTVTAQLSVLSGKEVQVPVSFGGTAVDPDDYSPSGSTITIPAGQMSADLTLTVVDDALDEGSELIDVAMGVPVNATPGATTLHTVLIQDNDAPPAVDFTNPSQSNAESVSPVTVTAQLSAVSGQAVQVPVTFGGTAADPGDYSPSSATITIPAGQASADLTLSIVDDGDNENDETVVVTMGAPVNATPGTTTVHTATIEDDEGPEVTLLEPDGLGDLADASFTIMWSDADPNDDASIDLFFDTDSSGEDGTLIVAGLSEDPDGAGAGNDDFVWDTSGVPGGDYFVYAVIDDGFHPTVVDYSDGPVTVNHPPTITVLEPDGVEDNAADTFLITWEDEDGEDDAMIDLFYDTDSSGEDGAFIDTFSENPDGAADQHLWDTSLVEDGAYFVYAVIDDGVNPPVVAYSAGPVTVDHSVVDCAPPASGDWLVTASCTMTASDTAPGDVIVDPGVVLTIDNGVTLSIDLVNHKLLVQPGGGVLVRPLGAIRQP